MIDLVSDIIDNDLIITGRRLNDYHRLGVSWMQSRECCDLRCGVWAITLPQLVEFNHVIDHLLREHFYAEKYILDDVVL